MRNRKQLLATPLLLVAQVVHTVPVLAADSAQASAPVEIQNQTVTFDLNNQNPVIDTNHQPDTDTDVLAPLQAIQAQEAAAKAAALAARKHRTRIASNRVVLGPVTGDVWYRLRVCESGNNYARNSGNGYFGAYQYNLGTW